MNDTKAETFDELSPIDWLIKLGREEKQPHTLLLDRAEADLARITAERDELFQLAVLTFKALEDIGLILTPNARALDSACTNLSPELWERIDVEASQ